MKSVLCVAACLLPLSNACCACGQADRDPVKDDDYVVQTFRDDPEFLWGTATAAGQVEGGWNASGKQPSIWDDFCHNITAKTGDTTLPFSQKCGKIPKGVENEELWTTLDTTDDFFSHYAEDLRRVKDYNMNAMSISLSWPRLMPLNAKTGKHELNPEGVDFYMRVFQAMEDNGITPVVKLYHWDLPNDLSWLNDTVVDEFVTYAVAVFKAFPAVMNWVTFNEPNSVCPAGYNIGRSAPGHKSTTDHLVCGHNLLKSHAKAVAAYRKKYHGQIGLVLDYKWAYPQDPSSEADKTAAGWDRDNVLGFWAEPVFKTGDYPVSVRNFYGDKLPKFTADEKKLLNGSADFFGLNTYGGKVAVYNNKTLADFEPDGTDITERYSFCPCEPDANKSAVVDEEFECGADSSWLWAKPDAMRQYLNHVHTYYQVPKIYVSEFGVDVAGESDMPKEDALKDTYRQEYFQRYMYQVALAKKEDGVPVRGIFPWSYLDNFEWADGLNFRFGITYVDYNDPNLTRTPKQSAEWWTDIISKMKPTHVMV